MADGFRVAQWSLEEYRDYLHVLARRCVSPRIQRKFDASDLVQNTLLDAHAHLDQFRGKDEPELKAWLRQILANNLANSIKALYAGKRNPALEQSLLAEVIDTSARLERCLMSVQPTPISELMRHDRASQLAKALNQLPEDQRYRAGTPASSGMLAGRDLPSDGAIRSFGCGSAASRPEGTTRHAWRRSLLIASH